jgi:uncharacterized damage-inducible protein DinB
MNAPFRHELELNVALLNQVIDFLADLDDDLYARPVAPISAYGIGPHVRHCVDFYDNFLSGVASGLIDYDRRNRDDRIASDRRAALTKLRAIRDRLRNLPHLEQCEILVASERVAHPHAQPNASSVGRELIFLAGHCVHHFAIIAMLAQVHGVAPPPGFGVAPSTLKHWEETACAR